MDYREFHELTRSMIELLKPRIDEKWLPAIESAMRGGEATYAVEDLVHIVIDDQIPVSAAELDTLRALAGGLGDGGDMLAKLEQVRPV